MSLSKIGQAQGFMRALDKNVMEVLPPDTMRVCGEYRFYANPSCVNASVIFTQITLRQQVSTTKCLLQSAPLRIRLDVGIAFAHLVVLCPKTRLTVSKSVPLRAISEAVECRMSWK